MLSGSSAWRTRATFSDNMVRFKELPEQIPNYIDAVAKGQSSIVVKELMQFFKIQVRGLVLVSHISFQWGYRTTGRRIRLIRAATKATAPKAIAP